MLLDRPLWLLLYLIILEKPSQCGKTLEGMRRRRQVNSLPLVFPYGATYKLLVGATFPIHNREKINMAFAANFQYQYVQIQNITQLSQYYFIKTVSREQRNAIVRAKRDERLIFYKGLENFLDAQGMNGKDCVLRAICEAAQYPVEEEGLIGEIMHILLTPDYGHSTFDVPDPDWLEAISKFKDAATAGRQMFSCHSVYSGCPEGQGLLELITKLREQ